MHACDRQRTRCLNYQGFCGCISVAITERNYTEHFFKKCIVYTVPAVHRRVDSCGSQAQICIYILVPRPRDWPSCDAKVLTGLFAFRSRRLAQSWLVIVSVRIALKKDYGFRLGIGL